MFDLTKTIFFIFKGFCRKMCLKWNFRNEPTPEFITTPAFNPKSTWKPPNVSPSLKPFFNLAEYIFEISETSFSYSKFSKEERQFLCSLADDRSIVIKKLIKIRVW